MKSLVWFITGASRDSVWKPLVPHLSAATLSLPQGAILKCSSVGTVKGRSR
jgi:hypothetical protein